MFEELLDLNTNISKLINIILFLMVVLLLFLYITKKPEVLYIKDVKIDTVLKIIQPEPIVIEKAKGKLVIREKLDTIKTNDTIYVYREPEFTASIDSIIRSDTMNVRYYYPQNLFDISIRRRPDTVKTITIEVTKKEEESLWIKAAYLVGGFMIGYIIK